MEKTSTGLRPHSAQRRFSLAARTLRTPTAVTRRGPAIAALATGSFGPALVEDMLSSGELTRLACEAVMPFYRQKAEAMKALVDEVFRGTEYHLHRIEGSIFCWIYLPRLDMPTLDFYRLLMEQGVVTVPGEYFFFGGGPGRYPHEHYDKCLRLNYSGDWQLVKEGVELIGELYRRHCM